MAELITDLAPSSGRCSEEALRACCEQPEKAACCRESTGGGGCGCAAGERARTASSADRSADIREAVRQKYAAAARRLAEQRLGACCGVSALSDADQAQVFGGAVYGSAELAHANARPGWRQKRRVRQGLQGGHSAARRQARPWVCPGRGDGLMATVLFVCRHNAGRWQMSATLFERAGQGRHRALSAGSEADPGGRVHPEVVQVMGELGFDLSDRHPQRLSGELAEQAGIVVTMGCGDDCPYIPGKRYIDWELPDPKGRPIDEVRALRDDIVDRVERLVAELDESQVHDSATAALRVDRRPDVMRVDD
jgi:arsenate reductase (thioredoxin)